ncbi:LacI family DNA-binding transcriptional regulator [Autumnicola musiva]|uniref:LacI family DNA-binding transcriptional regulator n=1 Tax=Autumnicola musiva TaxID=3075589 RepID=A0ABU3D6Y9_9FLAO|nr:LacI family DNA-binding transcriptional regulator [Zunongwangia sp. F117]MDT0677196.1 LacI family DNA-binding transcriptional regulator [Zunongwangia sp. F117]
MKKRRITLKDLANELNLAPSTISRAIANHPAISEATKKIVNQKAKELGFIPNSIASSFRKKKTTSLGIIVPRIDIHFHSLVISGIEEFAYKASYNVTIFQSKDSLDRELEIVRILQTKMVDGIIACLSLETDNYEHFKKLEVPVVFYDRVPENYEASKVVINDFESAIKATEHLISIGCKRIAHIAGNPATSIFKARLEGYKAALTKNNLPIKHNLIEYTKELSYEEGVKCAKRFLKLQGKPDGIFCANDYTAVSALQVFKKANYEIPKDVAVIGFSNYPISKIIEPKITTVNDRAFEMGQAAANLLIRQIEEKNEIISSETIVLETQLIIRKSTKKNIHTNTP